MDENLRDDAEVIISDEEVDTQEQSTSGDEETTEQSSEEVVSKKQFDQVLARAKRAEDTVRKFKTSNETKAPSNLNNVLSREEAVLIARGYDDESLNQIQVIAKGKGISMLDAEKDPLFVSYKEKKESEAKAEKAKLGASKGSGQKESKPGFNKFESLSDHKKLWEEANNNS